MDSIAYFAGKRLGKRPFINNVSPNKTMEGFLTAIIVTPLLLFFHHKECLKYQFDNYIFIICGRNLFSYW